MNKGTQPKRRGRPRKIQQPAPEETARPAEETEGVPEKKKKLLEVESEGSSRAGQDDKSGGSQSEDSSGKAVSVWSELDKKPSPEVRPADIKIDILSFHSPGYVPQEGAGQHWEVARSEDA